jgi:hypothetical protein
MTPLHLLELGAPVDMDVLEQLLQSQGNTELVRGILQMIRDTALDAACGSVDGLGARDDTFIHASLGRYDGLASVLRELLRMTAPRPKDADSEDASMLDNNEVPTA